MAAPVLIAARLDAILAESLSLEDALAAVSALRRDIQEAVERQRAQSQRHRERKKAALGTTYTPANRAYYLEHKAQLNAGRAERRRRVRSDRPQFPLASGQETPTALTWPPSHT